MQLISIPGDKSISHRFVMLAAISNGIYSAENFLMSDDTLATINIFRQLGVTIDLSHNKIVVHGVGRYGLQSSREPLDCQNSGTSMRLLTGLLCAQKFDSILIGDSSLAKRPMRRVIEPLHQMGAVIHAAANRSEEHTSELQSQFHLL